MNVGAIFEADMETPISFANHDAAIQAVRQGVAICDRSHWGLLQITDVDRLNFLHNQSTNDFKSLQPGQGCDTLFVTSTARTIDLATVYVLEDAALVLLSPNRREKLSVWLDRYIFFGDKVKLTDITGQVVTFSLIGPTSHALLDRLGAGAISGQPYGSHQLLHLAEKEIRVAVGSGLASEGYTLLIPTEDAAVVWKALVEAGAIPLGDRDWEQLRIEQGRPMPDQELTEDFNAVEACLWQAISINKGCYIGQETIARLDTYKGVKQQLWGIRFSAIAPSESIITLGGEKVGVLTSLAETQQGTVGLGYIRTKAGGAGLKVQVGDSLGEVVEVPFLRRER